MLNYAGFLLTSLTAVRLPVSNSRWERRASMNISSYPHSDTRVHMVTVYFKSIFQFNAISSLGRYIELSIFNIYYARISCEVSRLE